METQIKIIGGLLAVLATIHVIFPKYFHWKKELIGLSLMNQQMMKVHTFYIALTVFLMGLLCLTSAVELTSTKLGNSICLGFAVFWTIRLFIQFFGYSPDTWKGKTFETTIHVLASMFWAYLSVVFWLIYLN